MRFMTTFVRVAGIYNVSAIVVLVQRLLRGLRWSGASGGDGDRRHERGTAHL
jgi:hypothetical protein